MKNKITVKIIDISILINHYIAGKHFTGIDRVNLAYIRRYRENSCAFICYQGRSYCFNSITSQKLFDVLLFKKNYNKRTLLKDIAGALFFGSENYHNAILFNIAYVGLESVSYSRIVVKNKLKPVYFLHDFLPLTHPEHFVFKAKLRHHNRLMKMINTGCGLILNSEDTLKNLMIYAEKYHLSLPPLCVAPLGVEMLPQSKQQSLIQDPYFVMLGTIEPRKNHLQILNIWRRMVEEKVCPLPKLVLIGYRGWECEQVIDMLERCIALKECVIEVSDCNDDMLSTWLCHARALLFPTFAEGYGLPLIEALSLGVPVIASDLGVFHEIAGSVPDYLDPLDGLGWFESIKNYTQKNSEKRQMQLTRIKNFKVTTWDDHFNLVDDFLERELLSSSL